MRPKPPCVGFFCDFSRHLVNVGLTSGKCVVVAFGIGRLGTPQVLRIETTVLVFEFSNNLVPFHSCMVVVYEAAELEVFQLEIKDVTFN